MVSQLTGISVELMHSHSLKRTVCDARNLAMLKSHEHLGLSTLKLMKLYDKESHTTILNAFTSAKNLIDTNPLAADRALRLEMAIAQHTKNGLTTKQLYNLHYRIRKKGFGLNRKYKTISIHPSRKDELRKGQVMKLLKQHGYNVQYSLI
jgi:hypothetical protein